MSAPLTPESWPHLEPLLDALLDAPPDGRAALLDELSGGDRARREELERLLAECHRSDPFLDRPAAERFAEIFSEPQARFPDALSDRYRPTRELGHGGMATVFLARDLRHDRDVAVKVMRPELALGRERFLREISIAAKLRHPHIVPLFDSGDASGVLYYVMPYEAGQSLRDRLRDGVALPVQEVVDILRDVCDALAYAHAQGIVHRDIKPDNVLLSGRTAMVTDFGVARAITEASGGSATSTGGVAIGTPAYMAPEQAAADPSIDHRADIYAFGVMAYELLSGRPPFIGDTPQVVLAHITETPMPVSALRPDVPEPLAAVVMKCLEKRTADRWQHASELREALDAAMKHGISIFLPLSQAVSAPPSVARARISGRQRRLGRAAVFVGVAAAIALGAWQKVAKRRATVEPSRPVLAIGIMPVLETTAGGELAGLATGLGPLLSIELTQVDGIDLRPLESIAASIARHLPLDSVARIHELNYLVRATLSRSQGDSVEANLELIEGGLRSVRVGRVFSPISIPNAVQRLARSVALDLRPLLGSRVRELQLETGTSNRLAFQHRRRADQYRLTALNLARQGDPHGASGALDSAVALLIESQRLDPDWTAAPLARASLVTIRVGPFVQARDTAATRRLFDASLALVDSVLRKHPRDAAALAQRGRLRWRKISYPGGRRESAVVDSARRDLEAALAIDSTIARAAADLSQLLEAQGNFAGAAAAAERAFRLDAFLEDASLIINRLAQSRLEAGMDEDAWNSCAEGVRRFPDNPAHYGCFLEVMAWGSGVANADSGWKYFRELERRIDPANVSARITYGAALAAILARAPGVPRDSARRVLSLTRDELDAAPGDTRAFRRTMLALEAAVLYRLGDQSSADRLIAQLRERDPGEVSRLAQRRMLRDYVRRAREPGP